jgi:hypothetical protein
MIQCSCIFSRVSSLQLHPFSILLSLIPSHISGDFLAWLGALGYLLLLFAPGAWISFGLELNDLPFWARLLMSAVLSPLVVWAEFYAIRLVGVPFGPTSVTLVFVNLPALCLVWKRRLKLSSLHLGDWIMGASAIIIPVMCMLPVLIHFEDRIHSPHGWLHADVVYMLARGDLTLEASTLAGIRLSFPVWSALVFQAVHSFLVNSAPVSCYIWNNLLSLIAVFGFAAGITRELGGGRLARLSSGIWLLIGANPVGYILMQIAPWGMSHELWGDMRYTPWVSKFLDFGPMPLALGMLSAMLFLLLRAGPLTKQYLAVIFLLLSGIGFFYPLLLPPACAFIGAKAIAIAAENPNWRREIPYRDWLVMGVLACLALVVTYAELKYITADRHVATSPILLSAIPNMFRKISESLVATSLFVAGLAFVLRNSWNSRRSATALLLCGALASYILYIIFNIPYYENEYKFIFSAVMCLAVFPAIAVERIWREWTRARSAALLAITAVLVLGTYAYWNYANWPAPWAPRGQNISEERKYTKLNATDFYIELEQREEWSGICRAVRQLTPADSILVVNNDKFYYPVLTARSLYVSAGNRNFNGVNHRADILDAGLRGYGQQILKQRRAALFEFFETTDSSKREQVLQALLALKRPLVVIAEPRHSSLLEYLRHMELARQLYVKNNLSLWLIDSPDTSQNDGRSIGN